MAAAGDYFDQLSSCLMIREHESDDQDNGVKELARLVSKLNPSAEEFVPLSCHPTAAASPISVYTPASVASWNRHGAVIDDGEGSSNHLPPRRRKNKQRRRINDRVNGAQKEDCIRRTVYVSDVDQHVSEEQLAGIFSGCGKVLDCRICGDPNSLLRFAFVEYANENGASEALNLDGTVLGNYPLKVMPSKTAILPVNPTFLPRSEDEREMCARTIYCTDIDKQISQADVKNFFETFCGKVSGLRLLGDRLHSTRIAFIEFVEAESAIIALNCSGFLLGSCPIRVSPSKTPLRHTASSPGPAETSMTTNQGLF
ncbi:polyadenylate-binding protein-interacting protein 10-like [Canna indica]|uniref:Polyadenylate-binding protein-interacting protein 10-like n=1 Tax=Canna indica TaxID=4628 RepID=A0AAQ3JSS9_9LILI|nr:polyadenylate-binding protein-interacting protein 10-like [Canna indica]